MMDPLLDLDDASMEGVDRREVGRWVAVEECKGLAETSDDWDVETTLQNTN